MKKRIIPMRVIIVKDLDSWYSMESYGSSILNIKNVSVIVVKCNLI